MVLNLNHSAFFIRLESEHKINSYSVNNNTVYYIVWTKMYSVIAMIMINLILLA